MKLTIGDLEAMAGTTLDAAAAAQILGCHPQSLRDQARRDPSALGFPVSIIGRRVIIPREPFIKWINGQ